MLPGLGPNWPVNTAHTLALVGHRVAAAQRRLVRIAEQGAEPAALHVRPPRHADIRGDVVPVGVVAEVPLFELRELGILASGRAGRVEIALVVRATAAEPGHAADVRQGHGRHDVVDRRKRHLHVPAQPGIDRQRRRRAPGVLHEQRVLVHLAGAPALAEKRVGAGVRIERRLSGDGGHAAGQDARRAARASVSWPADASRKLPVAPPVNMTLAGSCVVLKPRLIPGTICCAFSQARPRKIDPPNVRLWLPLLPAQRLVEGVLIGASPGRTVLREPVLEIDVVVRVEIERMAIRVLEGLRPVGLGLAEVRDAPARKAPAQLADEVTAERRSQRDGSRRAVRDELAIVRAPWETGDRCCSGDRDRGRPTPGSTYRTAGGCAPRL